MNLRACVFLFLLSAASAMAGVGQGNPKRSTFFSMKQDYEILIPRGLEVLHGVTGTGVRLDVPLPDRLDGYFWFDATAPDLPAEWHICDQTQIPASKATLFWVGRDCGSQVFKQEFGELVRDTVGIRFPH
jgi:hypothetical protein